jgi:hypothetical protein
MFSISYKFLWSCEMSRFKEILIVLIYAFTISIAQAGWNGAGVIKTMYIYPDYAVIVQGDSGSGLAPCENSDIWSFNWSQFDQATQNRIQSMLLTAYTSKTPIQVVVDDVKCGPEGKKLFNGQIQLP